MRTLNKYWYKELLLNGNPQWESFNKEDLIGFLEVAKQMIKELKEQLQQRDEVIDEAINKIEDLRMEKWAIMGTDIMDILDILTKYKGDNND